MEEAGMAGADEPSLRNWGMMDGCKAHTEGRCKTVMVGSRIALAVRTGTDKMSMSS
jgi:hypothetical protein